jgi:hypothetical protein
VADGLALAELVDVGLDLGGADVEVLVEEADHAGGAGERLGVGGVFLHGEQLDAVAGGEDDGFADTGLVGEGAGRVGKALDGDGEALADLDGRGGVVHAEKEQLRV